MPSKCAVILGFPPLFVALRSNSLRAKYSFCARSISARNEGLPQAGEGVNEGVPACRDSWHPGVARVFVVGDEHAASSSKDISSTRPKRVGEPILFASDFLKTNADWNPTLLTVGASSVALLFFRAVSTDDSRARLPLISGPRASNSSGK